MEDNYYNSGQSETISGGVPKQNNTLGVVGLVTGIMGLIFAFCCSPLGTVLGIVALICGIIGLGRGQRFALAGIIMGAISIVLGVLLTIFVMPLIMGGFIEGFLEGYYGY